MRPTRHAIVGTLLLLYIGGCGRWEDFATAPVAEEDALENAGFDFVRITTRTGPILLPDEGVIGPSLVRITTPGERQILISSPRVRENSIYGLLPVDSINRPEVVVPFDSVAMLESWENDPYRRLLWMSFGTFLGIVAMVTYSRR